MKIKTIALLGLAGMLAVACGDDAKTKGSLAVTVQLASDLTDVTTVQITALSEADFDAADVTAAAEKLADLDVSGTTLGQVVKELKAGTYRITASAYAGDATVDGASRTAEVTVKADGVVLVALTLSGSTDLVIGGITASNAAPKTGDVVTLTADVSGNAGGSLVWTDNCDGDYVTNGAASVEWSSAFVEHCTLTLTATNPATSATATINLAVGGAKGSLERVVGNGFCHWERQAYDTNSDQDGNVSGDYGGRVLDGSETARNFPLNDLAGIDIDGAGNVIFVEKMAGRIWKYNPTADTLTRVAGNVDPDTNDGDVHGDGGPAIAATFEMPVDIEIGPEGDLYIVDAWDYVVRKIDGSDYTIDSYAGISGDCCSTVGGPYNGREATNAKLYGGTGLAVDGNENLYVGDANYWHWAGNGNGSGGWIAKVFANTETVYTYPETLTQPTAGDVGAWDVEVVGGYLYSSARFEHAVSRLNLTTGEYEVIAGKPNIAGNTGDGGDAIEATLFDPRGLFVDSSNDNVFVADHGNQSIRIISSSGKISLAVKVPGAPGDVVMDAAKNLYYTDRDNCSVVKVYGPY